MVKRSFLFLFLSINAFSVSLTSVGFTQIDSELQFITTNNPISKLDESEERELFSFASEETSEIKLFSLGVIRLYQLFVSSQQNNLAVCIFTPSCSRFGSAAIKKYGIFYGILMTSDRLQRCHGFGKKYYPIHSQTGKSYDPIEPHFLEIRLNLCRE
jgi:putative component of membrane protein insertase Oxa1/YidC/SpoIIIJ protein YidD